MKSMKTMVLLLLSAICLRAQPYRVVDGKTYNLKTGGWQYNPITRLMYQTDWQSLNGKVYSVQNGGVVLVRWIGKAQGFKHYFILNYPGIDVAKDQMISPLAMQVGTTNIFYAGNQETFEVWDCGVLTNAPPPEEVAAEKAQAAEQLAKREEQRQKNLLVQSNTVLHLQTLATNGEAWAQCSLGKHYLNGQGCETNRELAAKWLKMAAGNASTRIANGPWRGRSAGTP